MPSLAELLAAKRLAEQAKQAAPTPAATSSIATKIVEKAKEQAKEPTPLAPAPSQAATDILERIHELESIAQENLKSAMDELKQALMANPDAVAIMMDEDIGMMVEALRKTVGESIAEASKPKAEKKAKKMMTVEELEAGWAEL